MKVLWWKGGIGEEERSRVILEVACGRGARGVAKFLHDSRPPRERRPPHAAIPVPDVPVSPGIHPLGHRIENTEATLHVGAFDLP